MSPRSDYEAGAPAWKTTLERLRRNAEAAGSSADSGSRNPVPAVGVVPAPRFIPSDWKIRHYCALDFETTGLDSRRDRVVEIGALQFEVTSEGRAYETGCFAELVHPGMPIPPSATAIHGIYDIDVSLAPRFGELSGALSAFIGDSIVIAHNAPFDMGFLEAEYGRLGIETPRPVVIDTLAFARSALRGRLGYSLGALAAHIGVNSGNAHRALDDARTCAEIFLYCARLIDDTER